MIGIWMGDQLKTFDPKWAGSDLKGAAFARQIIGAFAINLDG